MGGPKSPIRTIRAAAAALALAGASLSLAGCVASSYAGIPLAAGAADPELQALAHRAQAGDKRAQLELGIRYEEGRGVRVDLERAERLYRMAASDSGGTQLVYVPASRPGGRAATVPINTGPRVPGSPAAAQRLERLERLSNSLASDQPPQFTSEDLTALVRRFHIDIGDADLRIYPGAQPRACRTDPDPPSLPELLDLEMGSSVSVVMPLSCLFGAYEAQELHSAANAGHPIAQFIYFSLLVEVNGCADFASSAALRRMSDNGYAPASIAYGNVLVRCGQRALGLARYHLAEQQGFIGARTYYRGLGPQLTPEDVIRQSGE